MADIDFNPIRERVEWAGRRIEQMGDLLEEFIRDRPVHVFLSRHDDQMVETATLTMDPPLHLSLALGDVTHNLRAALDNLVGAVRVGGPTRTSAFPLAESEERFGELARSKMEAVPAWAVNVVKDHQPFGEYGHIGSGLLSLDRMSQVDRHRALVLHAPIVDARGTYFTGADTTMGVHVSHPDSRTTVVSYPVGIVYRTEYTVRVAAAEPIDGVDGIDIVPLATSWLNDVRAVVNATEDELDRQWQRGEWTLD